MGEHNINSMLLTPVVENEIYITIAALTAKICPQNLTNCYPLERNSTAIIASIFMCIHVANPGPLDRFLLFIVLCLITKKIVPLEWKDANMIP